MMLLGRLKPEYVAKLSYRDNVTKVKDFFIPLNPSVETDGNTDEQKQIVYSVELLLQLVLEGV
ncbi:hypothetical protein ACFLS9_04065 [Bacteroidota bacterium]